jgi:hypothetical protein
MIKIPGLTLRGLIKGARTTDRRSGDRSWQVWRQFPYSLEQHSLDTKTTRQTKYMIVRTSFINSWYCAGMTLRRLGYGVSVSHRMMPSNITSVSNGCVSALVLCHCCRGCMECCCCRGVVVVGFSSVLTIAHKASGPSQLLLVACVIPGIAQACRGVE